MLNLSQIRIRSKEPRDPLVHLVHREIDATGKAGEFGPFLDLALTAIFAQAAAFAWQRDLIRIKGLAGGSDECAGHSHATAMPLQITCSVLSAKMSSQTVSQAGRSSP